MVSTRRPNHRKEPARTQWVHRFSVEQKTGWFPDVFLSSIDETRHWQIGLSRRRSRVRVPSLPLRNRPLAGRASSSIEKAYAVAPPIAIVVLRVQRTG